MANTRQSTKRAKQEEKRHIRNLKVLNSTKTVLKNAMTAILKKDSAKAKTSYEMAIRALSKAASKRAIPKGRAERKISRLTLLVKKTMPEILAK